MQATLGYFSRHVLHAHLTSMHVWFVWPSQDRTNQRSIQTVREGMGPRLGGPLRVPSRPVSPGACACMIAYICVPECCGSAVTLLVLQNDSGTVIRHVSAHVNRLCVWVLRTRRELDGHASICRYACIQIRIPWASMYEFMNRYFACVLA